MGSKTTVRLQNVIYCGFHEFSNEICLHYTGFKVRSRSQQLPASPPTPASALEQTYSTIWSPLLYLFPHTLIALCLGFTFLCPLEADESL